MSDIHALAENFEDELHRYLAQMTTSLKLAHLMMLVVISKVGPITVSADELDEVTAELAAHPQRNVFVSENPDGSISFVIRNEVD